MRTSLRYVFLLLFSTLAARANDKPISFADLPHGDTLVVTYHIFGCWCDEYYEFTYSSVGYGSFEVQALQMKISDSPTFSLVENARRRLGFISLEEGEAQKLDKVLALYRKPVQDEIMSGGTALHLVQMRDGRVVKEEHVSDRSISLSEKIHALGIGFGEMLDALQKMQEKRAAKSR